MELADPTLSSVIKEVVQSEGVKDFLVHPLFISPLGKHVRVDIPEIVREINEEVRMVNMGRT
jgi:sirohydrochlorin ferrochelatase